VQLPHSLKRGFRNDGSTGPLIFPDEFRTYAVLDDWTPHSITLNLYVLDDNNDVVFTFEGNGTPIFSWHSALIVLQGMHFEAVQQGEPEINERFSTIWQPRALPQSNIRGDTLLDIEGQETQEVFTILDNLALNYTKKAVR
jgi:fatty acid synthase, animal type